MESVSGRSSFGVFSYNGIQGDFHGFFIGFELMPIIHLEHAQMMRRATVLYRNELQTTSSARSRLWLEIEIQRLNCVVPTPAIWTEELIAEVFNDAR